ncbi:MAG: DUF4124 domain-containing protein [Burkholderiaceae bacterium]
MNRLLMLCLLALFQQSAFSAVYKCDKGGGKIEYQETPCPNGSDITSKVTRPGPSAASQPAATTFSGKQCVGDGNIDISFAAMPIRTTLSVLADYSGNKLVADPAIVGSAAFNYECMPWTEVLKDIAARHDLVVRVESGTIFARRK